MAVIPVTPIASTLIQSTPDGCPLWGGPFVTVPECGTCETNNRQIQDPQCGIRCMQTYISADAAACDAVKACKQAAKEQYISGIQEAQQSYRQCLQFNHVSFCDAWLQSMMQTLKEVYLAEMETCAATYISDIGTANGAYLACMLSCCKTCNIDLP
jgi:hypothetical protein